LDSTSLARTTTRDGLFQNCRESLRSIEDRERLITRVAARFSRITLVSLVKIKVSL
jgi:predicted nuclease of restriction endonuclease-like RecB superfamily